MPWSPALSRRPLVQLITRSSAIRSAHAATAHREEENDHHPSSQHHTTPLPEENDQASQAGPSRRPGTSSHGDRKGKSRARDSVGDTYRFPTIGRDGRQPGPFEILGLERNATPSEIKSQYYRLALLLHPDSTHPSSSPANFATLNKAYTLLSSPSSRQSYLTYNHGWHPDTSTPPPRYDPSTDPMYAEVLRRKQAGAGMSSRYRGDAGFGAWGAYGLDGKWREFPEAGVGGEPKYMSHSNFAGVLFALYHRLNGVTQTRMEILEEKHMDASHALASAREEAKIHGQARREQIRRRVNETKTLREIEKQEQGADGEGL